MQGAALGVDQLDRLRHRVGIFPAVLHGFEAQAGAVPMRVLRTLVGRHHCKFTGAAEPGFNPIGGDGTAESRYPPRCLQYSLTRFDRRLRG